MNNLEKAITIEYKILLDKEREYLLEFQQLPTGSVQHKIIKGKPYYYLQYREGKQVKSKYIKKDQLDDTTAKISHRKFIESELSDIKAKKKALESVIDKDRLFALVIGMAVNKVAKNYPDITKVYLFGSRAESRYRDDSDVDLLFESTSPVSLMKQTEIRMQLEDELGLSVDLVHGPLTEDSYLQIGKAINIYET